MDPEKLSSFLARECTFNPAEKQDWCTRLPARSSRPSCPCISMASASDMDEILEVAQRYDLPVVEDACQAIGATYKGRKAGAMGDLGCFSFFPSKNLGGAGDGGMVITSNPQLAERVRLLRTHGAHPKYLHSIVGFNSRLDELQAAILRVKLPYLQEWSEARGENALKYIRDFAAADLLSCVTPPVVLPSRTHIYHQFVIRCRKRDALLQFLKAAGIGTEIYYPVSMHEQECFRYLGYAAADMPHSYAASKETLALPIYPELSDEQRGHVVKSIAGVFREVTCSHPTEKSGSVSVSESGVEASRRQNRYDCRYRPRKSRIDGF